MTEFIQGLFYEFIIILPEKLYYFCHLVLLLHASNASLIWHMCGQCLED